MDDRDIGSYARYAVKFLHVFASHLESVADAGVTAALPALAACHRLARRHQAAPLTEPLTIEKLVYHIAVKLLKRVRTPLGLGLAQ